MIKTLTIALVLGIASAAKLDHLVARSSNQQGYNYDPPAQPSQLYETPSFGTPPTTRPPPPPPTRPPPPPANSYLPPQAASNVQTFSNPPVRPVARPPPRPVVRPPPPPRPTQAPSSGPLMLMPYDFNYAVNDEESGNMYSRQEASDGAMVSGEYRVLMPDGRTQVVRYFDNGGGFNAEVTYE